MRFQPWQHPATHHSRITGAACSVFAVLRRQGPATLALLLPDARFAVVRGLAGPCPSGLAARVPPAGRATASRPASTARPALPVFPAASGERPPGQCGRWLAATEPVGLIRPSVTAWRSSASTGPALIPGVGSPVGYQEGRELPRPFRARSIVLAQKARQRRSRHALHRPRGLSCGSALQVFEKYLRGALAGVEIFNCPAPRLLSGSRSGASPSLN